MWWTIQAIPRIGSRGGFEIGWMARQATTSTTTFGLILPNFTFFFKLYFCLSFVFLCSLKLLSFVGCYHLQNFWQFQLNVWWLFNEKKLVTQYQPSESHEIFDIYSNWIACANNFKRCSVISFAYRVCNLHDSNKAKNNRNEKIRFSFIKTRFGVELSIFMIDMIGRKALVN